MQREPRSTLLHGASGYLVEPASGLVWSESGRRLGAQYRDGYVRIIQRLGRLSCRTWYAHRLVWEAANGSIPDGMEIDHLDGDKANNRVSNLQVVSGPENRRRQRERCLRQYGSQSSTCKLTPAEVLAVMSTQGNVPTKDWARRLSVTPSLIRSIRKGRTWKHLTESIKLPCSRPKRA